MELKTSSVTKKNLANEVLKKIKKGYFHRMGNRNEKSDNPLSHVAPFFKQVDFHNVKYYVVIDLTSLYISINGD